MFSFYDWMVFITHRNKNWRFVCILSKRSYSGRWWRFMLNVLASVIKIKSRPKLKPVHRHFWKPCSWSIRPHLKQFSKKTLLSLSCGLKANLFSKSLNMWQDIFLYPESTEWSILSIECHCCIIGLYNQLRGIKRSFRITSKSTGWFMRYCIRSLRNGWSYLLPWVVCKNGSLSKNIIELNWLSNLYLRLTTVTF